MLYMLICKKNIIIIVEEGIVTPIDQIRTDEYEMAGTRTDSDASTDNPDFSVSFEEHKHAAAWQRA